MNLVDRTGNQPPSFSMQLRIPPLPRYASSARAALTAFAGYHNVAQVDVECLTFALGEALANAIEHARAQSDIAIGFDIDDSTIVATVSDRGQGLAQPPRTSVPMPATTSEAGRGFAIMQLCTDFFHVRTAPGDGTVITLGRYRR